MSPNEAGARRGVVYLVGAGPGDPGLITVRGRDLLASCDAVVYDALANPTLLVGLEVERYDVGKRGGSGDSARQEEISGLLVRLAHEGKRVVRLKGGDPFVFGRGSEEAQALAASEIPFEVVPGITAGIAAPAYAGIPVTHRGLSTSVTFVTGHEDATKGAPTVDWSALARSGSTLVLYMGVRSLPGIVEALRAANLPDGTPAAAVQWGTHAAQRTIVATLATLEQCVKEAALMAPVIFVIGDVVSLRDEIAWFERRALSGWRVLVTRAQSPSSTLARSLAEAGAEVVAVPATRIEALDTGRLRAAISHLDAYDWIAFTSQNAVEQFWRVLQDCGLDTRALAALRVVGVGPATADALLAHGISVDVTPDMGPFQIVPGTQFEPGDDFDGGMFPDESRYADYEERMESRFGKRGSVSIRSGLALHRGSRSSNRGRLRPVAIVGIVSQEDRAVRKRLSDPDDPDVPRLRVSQRYLDSLPADLVPHLSYEVVADTEKNLPPHFTHHTFEGLKMAEMA